MDSQPAQKRRKINHPDEQNDLPYQDSSVEQSQLPATTIAPITNPPSISSSLRRSISPPAVRRNGKASLIPSEQTKPLTSVPSKSSHQERRPDTQHKLISSPVQLSHVEGLSFSNNIDTVGLRDIIGDPLIRECWVFNYLFDINFLMSNFDEDVRELVQVRVVHGSWRSEDPNKMRIDEAVKQYSNVRAITAYMPEAYGTHHSKMIILFRHDDHAQVIILTANIVPGDWRMCQAVWRSPLLPLQDGSPKGQSASPIESLAAIGSGVIFKRDLLAYLRTYGQAKLGGLTAQLKQYNFSGIRAALVASTPGKQNLRSCDPETETIWGWPGFKGILRRISTQTSTGRSHIVIQVSSVASLGAGNKWLDGTLFDTLATTAVTKSKSRSKPRFSLVFPTADEIRRSLDGYSSGGSIHMKTQSTAQANQLAHLRPMLCHWAGDGVQPETSTTSAEPIDVREAGRRRAAPHIKTYIRFNDESMQKIDWAMVTSANLSTQAWGAAINGAGEVRICSYEIGVVVWPALWGDGVGDRAEMVPVFKKDMPDVEKEEQESPATTRVGWRMPYDLPLVPYAKDEMPWCATAPDEEPDWMGRSWSGFEPH